MEKLQIVLASGSSARKELMKKVVPEFVTDPADIDERSVTNKSAKTLVKTLAFKKAEEVSKRHPNSIVIGSDLIVALRGHQVGKPQDIADAKKILQLLRGKTHQIMSGIAIICTKNNKSTSTVDVVDVTMRNYSDAEIDEYIATEEPLGKGGAYAIQGLGRKLIKDFDGDMEIVMGLSTKTVKRLMKKVQSSRIACDKPI